MTQKENAKNKMYKSVLSFLTASLAVFTGFTRLLQEIKNFTTLNTTLDGFVQSQGKTISGITEGKMSTFETLVKNTVRAARKALVYAKDQNDDNLVATFDVSAKDFTHSTETNALTLAQNICDALNSNSVALEAGYMITAADISDISDGIAAFAGQQQAPANAASARIAARKSIDTTMKQIDSSLDIIDDLIEHTYDESNAELVEEYFANRTIDNIGVRHSGISAVITDAATNAPLEGAVMAIESLNKTATADINGAAELVRVTPGTYHISFSMAGYTTQTPTLTIEKGKIGTIAIALVSGAPLPPIHQA